MVKTYAPQRAGQPVMLSHIKPRFIVDDLADLQGPSAGSVRLPLRLDWSRRATFNLGDPVDVRRMLGIVLAEANSEDDLRAFINGDLLRREWSALLLGDDLRRQWESEHPELLAC